MPCTGCRGGQHFLYAQMLAAKDKKERNWKVKNAQRSAVRSLSPIEKLAEEKKVYDPNVVVSAFSKYRFKRKNAILKTVNI